MTEEQKKEIENRLNWIGSHSYNIALEHEFKGICFMLKILGYYASLNFGEYQVKKISH